MSMCICLCQAVYGRRCNFFYIFHVMSEYSSGLCVEQLTSLNSRFLARDSGRDGRTKDRDSTPSFHFSSLGL